MACRIGIDTGGTFTDIVLVDEASGETATVKIASTPGDPARAVLTGWPSSVGRRRASIRSCSALPSPPTRCCSGAARVCSTSPPLASRTCQPAARRQAQSLRPTMGAAAAACRPSRHHRRRRAGAQRRNGDPAPRVGRARPGCRPGGGLARRPGDEVDGDRAVSVNLLFSYANPAHERRIAEHLARRFPDLAVSLSSDVSPLWREYERASTTILDAYTRPLLRRFLSGLEQRLRGAGYRAPLAVMKSNGGRMLARAAVDRPIQLLLSGLSGGVIAVAPSARRRGGEASSPLTWAVPAPTSPSSSGVS